MVQARCEGMLESARNQFPHLAFRCNETYRENKRQRKLYHDGKSYVSAFGAHYFRIAFDVAFGTKYKGRDNQIGKLTLYNSSAETLQVYKFLADYWHVLDSTHSYKHDWGGNWRSFVDKPHFAIYPVGSRGRDSINAGKKLLSKDIIENYTDTDIRQLDSFSEWAEMLA